MGQSHQKHLSGYVSPIVHLFDNTWRRYITDKLNYQRMSYHEFLIALNEMNHLCENFRDLNGKRLVFGVKRGTDETSNWKDTVQIAAARMDTESGKVYSFRLLTLADFLALARNVKCQRLAAEQSEQSLSQSSAVKECCICLERKQEVILPCAHSYCSTCISLWNQTSQTCPICREALEGSNEMWLISDTPDAREICSDIETSLLALTSTK